MGRKEKTTYEKVIEFLDSHDGKIMRGAIINNGKRLKAEEMTQEEQEETNLYSRWCNSEERKALEKYEGRPIKEVPEEYREKIAKLREFGLGRKEKTTYEEVIDFLDSHDGKIMRGAIINNGKRLKAEEMTQEEQEEVNLYARWSKSNERKKLEKYAGRPIEEVPEEYREKIALLRSYGYGLKPKRVTKKSLGQAGFGSPVEECDKAQADLKRRVEELESAKGVTQDEN